MLFRSPSSECCGDPPGRSHPRAGATRCAQVRSYRYTSPDDSLLEQLCLNRFWNFGVQFFPTWFAPNLMTVVGGVFALGAYAILLWFSPELDGQLPAWASVACAAMLFVYQSMDGMDGKQARRTGSGSPLGEVTDHGADAILCHSKIKDASEIESFMNRWHDKTDCPVIIVPTTYPSTTAEEIEDTMATHARSVLDVTPRVKIGRASCRERV